MPHRQPPMPAACPAELSILPTAANQHAIAAAAMQMDQSRSGNVFFSKAGIESSSRALSRKVRAMRMKSAGSTAPSVLMDECSSMESMIREEDSRDAQ